MKIIQFVASDDGGSVFEEIDIQLENERAGADGFTLLASETFGSDAMCFVCLPADLDQDWHQAPTRQLVFVVAGTVEVTTTDNAVRQWRPGDVFIAADVTGRGHKTRVIGGPATVIFAPLAQGVFGVPKPSRAGVAPN